MAYERLGEALRQLKTDREREEATEKQQKREGEEARMRFAQIKTAVIGPIFNEIVAHLVAEGFFGEMVNEQSDASDPISLNVNLSEDEGFSRQGTFQVRFDLDKYRCEFGKSTMAKASSMLIRLTPKSTRFSDNLSVPSLTGCSPGFRRCILDVAMNRCTARHTSEPPPAR